jgi:hypothetical protein
MTMRSQKFVLPGVVLLVALLLAEPAAAFRCGSKLVRDGMHEAQVVQACGKPTTLRNLGVAVRAYDYRYYRQTGPGWSGYRGPVFSGYVQEVVITEYTYNFGPRKLMRRLLFEGGVLVSIETIGYGYNE